MQNAYLARVWGHYALEKWETLNKKFLTGVDKNGSSTLLDKHLEPVGLPTGVTRFLASYVLPFANIIVYFGKKVKKIFGLLGKKLVLGLKKCVTRHLAG